MTTVNNILSLLADIAPLSTQESYDNAGLLIGDPNMAIDKALITLDVTEEVVDEAIAKSCKLIISHHPLIFKPLKQLTPASATQKIVIKMIANGMALISMHTNLDNSFNGVNHKLADILELHDLSILQPMSGNLLKLVVYVPTSHCDKVRQALFGAGCGCIGAYDECSFGVKGRGSFRAGEGANPYVGQIGDRHYEEEEAITTILPSYCLGRALKALVAAHPYEEPAYDIFKLENDNPMLGAGMIGTLDKSMTETEFLAHVSDRLNASCLRHNSLKGHTIRKVAICGGSGAFLIQQAIKSGADAYVTADVKYHEFADTSDILLIDAGHFETEQYTKLLIKEVIIKKIPNFAALISEKSCNPVNYFVK